MTLTFKLEIIDRVKVNQQSSVSNVLIKGQLLQKLLMSGHTHTQCRTDCPTWATKVVRKLIGSVLKFDYGVYIALQQWKNLYSEC